MGSNTSERFIRGVNIISFKLRSTIIVTYFYMFLKCLYDNNNQCFTKLNSVKLTIYNGFSVIFTIKILQTQKKNKSLRYAIF